MRPLVSCSSRVLALAALLVLACACAAPAPKPSVDANAPIVQRYPASGGGEIQVTVQHRYPAGQPVVLQVVITAGTRAIRGPLGAQVLSSGIEGEKVIRTLSPAALDGQTVAPRTRAALAVTWDGRTDGGEVAPRDTYTLTLDFAVDSEPMRVGTTIELATF